ncbi:hypothetical protein [Actinoplanes sp. G11-F43]|uniref:hypothetical protein n=1 Tax=Actinoplanes sp. G11-F43 TaxID=3424130 RepID=UPI003D354F73
MSSTADIADAATEVQESLTTAEAELTTLLGQLPAWYLALRDNVHGLVTAGAWAVGEDHGAAIMGFRCQDQQPHQRTCEAYRAAEATDRYDDVRLTTCPKRRHEVHKLFSDGNCYGCWKADHGEA